MNKEILRIERLSHSYNGSAWAIRDINFKIHQTGILGLLGSNGAGKSTTMNIICGVLRQTEGGVFIDGIPLDANPEEAKAKIGFLPQTAPLYPEHTVDEYLTYCAFLRKMKPGDIKSAIAAVKERCGITHMSKRLIGNLSGGYRQRVGIAQAIIHRPKLVILDEPTNGLDPNQIAEVRSLIKEIALERAVIFSSHILSEVQMICNDIIMIEGGQTVFADTMTAFNNYIKPHSVLLDIDNPPDEAAFLAIRGVQAVNYITQNKVRLFFDTEEKITRRIIEHGVNAGWQLNEITLDKSTLDEVFAQLSKTA
jgi:ABC-2 type transport system ATP-binding protein